LIFKAPGQWLPAIGEALGVLHRYGLASNDALLSNFIITPENTVKIIDLTLNGPMPVCQANDILKMRRTYYTEVPARGAARFLTALISLHKRIKHRLRVWRGKVPPPVPPKIWESQGQYLTFQKTSQLLGLETEAIGDPQEGSSIPQAANESASGFSQPDAPL
jgi:hypothetical protein